MTTKLLTSLLIGALLSTTALANDKIVVSMVDGKQRAEFTLNGDLACVLENERIRCTPSSN